jgi:hypothetical protein
LLLLPNSSTKHEEEEGENGVKQEKKFQSLDVNPDSEGANENRYDHVEQHVTFV